MSVLPSEIAKALGKDQRTIRRWCERGFIDGAYQTEGGHWRIRAQVKRSELVTADSLNRRGHDGDAWLLGAVLDRIIAEKIKLPEGFERNRLSEQQKLHQQVALAEIEAETTLTIQSAETVVKVNAITGMVEWSGGPRGGFNGDQLRAIRKRGYWWYLPPEASGRSPTPAEEEIDSLSVEELPGFRAAMLGSQHKPVFTHAVAVAWREIAQHGKATIGSVARGMGYSRATAFRKGWNDDITRAIAFVVEPEVSRALESQTHRPAVNY